ncbi:Acyltransferase family protein [Lachnospiraceae bacterium XPB1003]|nr:Acyltransferase family protein [Lachnospiraceae bacterium XPB1003]
MKNKERMGNYELLRIVAAIFIILNHIDFSMDQVDQNAISNLNMLIVRFFHLGGKFGTNVFVLLGGWFLYSEPLKIRRVVRIIVDVFVYGSIMYCAASIINGRLIGAGGLIKSYSYWFPFAYVIAIFASPFVHKISANKSVLKCIILVGGVFFTLLTVISGIWKNYYLSFFLKETIIGPIWFIYVFCFVNFIKATKFQIMRENLIKYLAMFCSCYLVMFVLVLILDFNSIRDMYSPVCFLAAISIFMFFSCIQVRLIRAIEVLAKSSFGTYLIQCNNNMWTNWNNKIFCYSAFLDTIAFYFVVFISVVTFFVIATIIEMIKLRIDNKKVIRKNNIC